MSDTTIDQDSTEPVNPPPAEGQTVDVTLQLRLPANHPVVTEDYLIATVTIGNVHEFTLDREVPLRPAGERYFRADYSDEWGPDGYQIF